MSALFDKQVNAQKENLKKTFGVHASFHKPTKGVMKMKETKKKKQLACKNVIDGRKQFIRSIQKTSENNFDELRVNDFGCNEGT